MLLTVLDRKWREHLYEMDYLREGIGLRAMAQRDPLVEYQREGGTMFNAMMEAFMEEVVGFLFNLEVKVQQPVGLVPDAQGKAVPMSAELLDELIASGPDADALGSLIADVDDEPEETPASAAQAKARPGGAGQGSGERRQSAVSYSAPSETGEATKSGADKADDPYAGVGATRRAPVVRARSSRCATDGVESRPPEVALGAVPGVAVWGAAPVPPLPDCSASASQCANARPRPDRGGPTPLHSASWRANEPFARPLVELVATLHVH